MTRSRKSAAPAAEPESAFSSPAQLLTLEVAEGEGGRLDRWLAFRLPDHSRSYLQKLIKDGSARLREGEAVPARYKVSAGEVFEIAIPDLSEAAPEGEDIPLAIAYEDDALLVVDKAAGIATHPSAGHRSGTLVNALVHHCGQSLSGINGVKRPGIVHRLDIGTSGLLLVAKSDAAHQPLAEALRRRDIERTYLALVQGEMDEDEGVIETYLGRDPRDRLRRAVVPKSAPDARHARTHWSIQRRYRGATLLRVRLETGRTHQVRVHLAHIRRPVVGDEIYGYQIGAVATAQTAQRQTLVRALLGKLGRPFLHAWRLRFEHPVSGEEVRLEAPLPPELRRVVDKLEEVSR